MARPKSVDGKRIKLTMRLPAAEVEQLEDLKGRMDLKSKSDVVSYLIAVTKRHRDDQDEMIYTLVDRLADHIEKRFQSLNTVQQLGLVLNDAFIKYVVSTLPPIPDELKDTAKQRGMDVYRNINIAAIQEFQRRRRTDAYSPTALGLEDQDATV